MRHPFPSKDGDVVVGRDRNKSVWPRHGYSCELAFLRVIRLCYVQESGRLWLCCATVQVGKAKCIPVRFEFAAGVSAVQCRLRLSCLAKEV